MGVIDYIHNEYDIYPSHTGIVPAHDISPVTDRRKEREMPKRKRRVVVPKEPGKGEYIDTYSKPFKDFLKEEINKDVLAGNLISIADHLDKAGCFEQANQVQTILERL